MGTDRDELEGRVRAAAYDALHNAPRPLTIDGVRAALMQALRLADDAQRPTVRVKVTHGDSPHAILVECETITYLDKIVIHFDAP